MKVGIDHDIFVLEKVIEDNSRHIERLNDLCLASLYRMTQSTSHAEIDKLRGRMAEYRSQIKQYENDGRESAAMLRKLRDMAGT